MKMIEITKIRCVVALLFFLLIEVSITAAFGQILPADRSIAWRPGLVKEDLPANLQALAGEDGIPVYPVGVNAKQAPYNAKGDGFTDDTAAIQNAIDSCPEFSAVLLPAGTYIIRGQLRIKGKSIVLRGEGADKTKVLSFFNGSRASIYLGGDYVGSSFAISGAPLKGSSQVTLTNSNEATSLAVGDLVSIVQDNDPSIVEYPLNSDGSPKYECGNPLEPCQGQLMRISGINGAMLSLSRPLYYTYNPTKNIRIYKLNLTKYAGVEDLYLEVKNPVSQQNNHNIYLYLTAYCWVKNIQSRKANGSHVSIVRSLGTEVRHSYFRGGVVNNTTVPYGVAMHTLTSDSLVEDNIFYLLHHSVVVQKGATGNVVGYNYSHRTFSHEPFTEDNFLSMDLLSHGGNSSYNLFEGNVAIEACLDYVWGSSRNNTFLRNHLERYSINGSGQYMQWGKVAVNVQRANLHESFIGNILCRPGDTGQVWDIGSDASYGGGYDARVLSTLIRHGNYDYTLNGGQGAVEWDPNISSRTIEKSLYLSSSPHFFGNVRWPPFDPTLTPVVGKLPAKARYIMEFNADSEDTTILDPTHLYLGADSSPPASPAIVRDGIADDVSVTTSLTQLSANWDAALDSESGVTKYWYAIGSSPGSTEVTDGWVDNGLNLSATSTELALVSGQIYYVSVRAQNGSALQGNVRTSDGQRVTGSQQPAPPINLKVAP